MARRRRAKTASHAHPAAPPVERSPNGVASARTRLLALVLGLLSIVLGVGAWLLYESGTSTLPVTPSFAGGITIYFADKPNQLSRVHDLVAELAYAKKHHRKPRPAKSGPPTGKIGSVPSVIVHITPELVRGSPVVSNRDALTFRFGQASVSSAPYFVIDMWGDTSPHASAVAWHTRAGDDLAVGRPATADVPLRVASSSQDTFVAGRLRSPLDTLVTVRLPHNYISDNGTSYSISLPKIGWQKDEQASDATVAFGILLATYAPTGPVFDKQLTAINRLGYWQQARNRQLIFQDVNRGGYEESGTPPSDDPDVWVGSTPGLGVNALFQRPGKQHDAETRIFAAGIAASAAVSTLIWLAETLFGSEAKPLFRMSRRRVRRA